MVLWPDDYHATRASAADGHAVFEAFATAKRLYVDRLRTGAIEEPTATDLRYRQVLHLTGTDPLLYGIAPNREMIERLIEYAVHQRILDRAPAVAELFAESTHELVG